jgi:anti-sigma factor RsiW
MTTNPCDCDGMVKQLDAFHRGELSDAETEALRHHLETCRHCTCIERHEQAFLERLRAMGKNDCCPEALKARVRAQCAEQAREH